MIACRHNKRSLIGLVTAVSLLIAMTAQGDILTTKHNLSVSGMGSVKATSEQRVCIFCHTPHHSSDVMPLWSRQMSSAIYNLYASNTLVAKPGQPTGSSRLCLSCHDGTIAIGMIFNMPQEISMAGGITTLPPGPTNLETDLSDDHPISFAYTSSLASTRGELADPALLPSNVKLEDGQFLQCSTCHDPHKDLYGKFLVMSNENSALCVVCHQKTDWILSSHASDPAVALQACDNCHDPHGAEGATHLMNSAIEENTCLLSCHNPTGDGIDIQTIFSKAYIHPVADTVGVHDPTETPFTMAKHVECQDCHNPHRVNNQNAPLANPPNINGRLVGVPGVDAMGVPVEEAANEYEICFKCHGDTSFVDSTVVPRILQDTNERLRFDSANPSYHPVTALGRNSNVPSLRPEYTTTSRIYCSDCHNNDQGTLAGGSGANGPHGSNFPHLFIAQYETDIYPLAYSVTNYALCFRCHDPNALFNPNVSTFGNSHMSHVQAHDIPCSICHDPHGVPASQGGNPVNNAHLINFDSRFVDPLTAVYDSTARSCTVSCHNVNPKSY